MISRSIDYLTAEHPAAAEYGRERIKLLFDTSDGRNIAVFLTAGTAASLLALCGSPFISYGALILTFIVWVQTSLLAGFMKQWLYIVVTAGYFMLPYVFILIPGTAEEAQASDLQYMLSELMQDVVLSTVKLLTGGNVSQLVSGGLFAACLVLFAAGAHLRSTAKRSDFYCRTRLEQLK
ncbi:MAG: hypothetical protein J6N15_10215 [Ruminiclostridium sp.]|nr:hypothetical protein [Ruminiclostridium sp.]